MVPLTRQRPWVRSLGVALCLGGCGDGAASAEPRSPTASLTPPVQTSTTGWVLDGNRCVVTAPPPTCEPRHLGAAPPPPAGAARCTAQADCADDAFCGAGHCRPREGTGELLTFCLEEVWYEGELDPPLYGQLVLSNGWYSELPYLPFEPLPRSSIASPSGDACRLVARRCERFPARPLMIDPFTDRGYQLEPPDECWLSTQYQELFFAFGDEALQPISEFLDQGCVELPMLREGASIWVSVWYP